MSRLAVPFPVKSFMDALERAGATVAPDAPADAVGEWWLDVACAGRTSNVGWRPDRGFGLYLSDEEAYGAKPDEIQADPQRAADLVLGMLRSGMSGPSA